MREQRSVLTARIVCFHGEDTATPLLSPLPQLTF